MSKCASQDSSKDSRLPFLILIMGNNRFAALWNTFFVGVTRNPIRSSVGIHVGNREDGAETRELRNDFSFYCDRNTTLNLSPPVDGPKSTVRLVAGTCRSTSISQLKVAKHRTAVAESRTSDSGCAVLLLLTAWDSRLHRVFPGHALYPNLPSPSRNFRRAGIASKKVATPCIEIQKS